MDVPLEAIATNGRRKHVDRLTSNLLWLGVEDFTGLWDAASEAQATEGLASLEEARDRARGVLETLLADGLIELYRFEALPQNDAVGVPREQRSRLLRDEWWAPPEEPCGASVWFDTTDKGFELYREEHNWTC